nr:glycosyltransferase family 4 protein [Maliibacterium massiliense]
MKKKICFVVQRYGLEVNGGAELHCRQLAEHMLPYYDVTVLTTKAVDYLTWKDEYSTDVEDINGVCVRRFSVDYPRDMDEFNRFNARFLSKGLRSVREQESWIRKQGPVSTALLRYLKASRDDYDIFIFFTYLYHLTVKGVPMMKEKALLIPTAHDEPYLKMEPFKAVFTSPRGIFYNTEEERQLILERFHNESVPSDLGGVGVEIPEEVTPESFREKYKLQDDYIVYVGRIDQAKGCEVMFQYWQLYKKRHPSRLKLVLMGKPMIPIPKRDDILSLGFVSDEDKFNGMAGAKFLLLPSPFESLSMVVLESLSLSVPVLVNGDCAVLKSHCVQSNAGLYYHGYYEFEGCVRRMLEHPDEYQAMCANAPLYVQQHYQWDVIVSKLSRMIEATIATN